MWHKIENKHMHNSDEKKVKGRDHMGEWVQVEDKTSNVRTYIATVRCIHVNTVAVDKK